MTSFLVRQHLSHKHAQKVRSKLSFIGVSGLVRTTTASGRTPVWHRATHARTSTYLGASGHADGKTILEALLRHRKSYLAHYP